jgi:nucleoside-diphosphate-sugar epimerase
MYILITGAAGFIGGLVARALLDDSSYTVLLTDIVEPPIPQGAKYPQNAKTFKADLQVDASKVIDKSMDAAFLFHGIMSAGSEKNFDLGISVNVDATRSLLEAMRKIRPGMRVIYSSSVAVYGQPLPEVVTEKVFPTPQCSYGAEKMICETLINEYNRRGFIDGFSLRLPTVAVRPGKPTSAASSFISSIIREPMNGREALVPIKDVHFSSWVSSPRTVCTNLLHVLKWPSDVLPPHMRTVNAPGILVTIQDMLDALEKVGGKDKLKYVKEENNPALERILRSWAWNFDTSLAYSLGCQADTSFEDAVRDYQNTLR